MTEQGAHKGAVLERLAALEGEGYETVAQIHEYVESGRDTHPATRAFLTTLRLDEDLALEVRDSMGRDVISASIDDHGEARYIVYTHDALAARVGVGTVRDTRVERSRGAADIVEGRRPHVVLRDATELAEIEAPDDWQAVDGPGQLEAGP